MDEVRNPFVPGAGSAPPELAGRDKIIHESDIALQRVLLGKHSRSQIMLGLRGTGKTVLLNKIERLAESYGYVTSFIEAPDDKSFAELIYPRIFQVLRKLSLVENAKEQVHKAWRALRSFASVFKVSMGDLSISVDPEAGTADSGILEYDVVDLFIRIGEVAQAAGTGWALFIDEVQYLKEKELSALIVAIHRVNQKNLPIIFFGAGLPQVAALSGNAKSYAERLFNYPTVGALDRKAAIAAISEPILEEEEEISNQALDKIFSETEGYPYFLQEWGFQSWNAANSSPINIDDVEKAGPAALRRLDEGFFRVRFDRLTPKEREYVLAMAKLGTGSYRSSEVADVLEEKPQSLAPCRANIIHKGMIYSQSYGDIDFTVPMFDDYLRRVFPEYFA
ncbi:MAG: ATP-binding protein [Alphaproteobacteria bacterium]|nr:ATP-binding protein [Alphaproteobacteria bacterium]